jgi:hypothetical protein
MEAERLAEEEAETLRQTQEAQRQAELEAIAH